MYQFIGKKYSHNYTRIGIIQSAIILLFGYLVSQNYPYEKTQIIDRIINYDMVKPGSKGSIEFHTTWSSDGLHLKEAMVIPNFEETIDVWLTRDLKPIRTKISGLVQNQYPIDSDISYKSMNANGYYKTASMTDPVDVSKKLTSETIVRPMAILLIHALPLKPGYQFTYDQFAPLGGNIRQVTYTVVDEKTITVPGGTFDTYMVKGTGGATTQYFYISKEAQRKVIKITFANTDWEYQYRSERKN